jgi:hypothetical protein
MLYISEALSNDAEPADFGLPISLWFSKMPTGLSCARITGVRSRKKRDTTRFFIRVRGMELSIYKPETEKPMGKK